MEKFKTINEHTISLMPYHYVRPVKNSLHPNLKALEVVDFKKQIEYFVSNFNIIAGDEFLEIIKSKKIPKKPSIVLIFDDGLLDHYEHVFPYLRKKKLNAYFYPPTLSIKNEIVLEVHKIHFFLEKEQNSEKILKEIDNILFKKKNIKISDLDTKRLKLKTIYDDRSTALIKSLLQHFLPQDDRVFIINELFNKIINEDEAAFAKKIYMNSKHLKEMESENMKFGSHGTSHTWLINFKKDEQKNEILDSINFFKKINLNTDNISVSYPFGSYNSDTIDICKELKISFGITCKDGSINCDKINNKFEFPRIL